MVSPSCTKVPVILIAEFDTYWSACFGWLLHYSYRGLRPTPIYLGTYNRRGVQFSALYNDASLGIVRTSDWHERTRSSNRNSSGVRRGNQDFSWVYNHIRILREDLERTATTVTYAILLKLELQRLIEKVLLNALLRNRYDMPQAIGAMRTKLISPTA